MEAELRTIGATVAQLDADRAAERRSARIVGTASLTVGPLFALGGFLVTVADLHHVNPLAMPLVLTGLPLLMYGALLRR